MKLNLNSKLLISILSVTTAIFLFTFGYIATQMRPVMESNVERIADENAGKYANLVRSHLTEEMKITRTMADNFEVITVYNGDQILRHSKMFQKKIFEKHSNYKSVWMSWELKYIDPNWKKDFGRYRITAEMKKGNVSIIVDSLNLLGDDINGLYYKLKVGKKDVLTEPYFDEFDGKQEMVASVVSPVINKGNFVGLAGIDIPLSRFSEIIKNAESVNSSTIFMVSNDGTFVGNQEEKMVGTSIGDIFKKDKVDILKMIKKGDAFSLNHFMEGRGEYYITFYPFKITETNTPWMVGVAVPRSAISAMSDDTIRNTMAVGILGFVILSLVIFFVSRGITLPLFKITKSLNLLAKGEIHKIKRLEFKSQDEIGDIANSTNMLIDGLSKTAMFAKEIGHGNLDANYETVSKNDILGNALVDMRASLQKAKLDENQRRRIEKEQNWATSGFAKFGELLRNNTDNMEDFTYSVISNLVKYTESNQGAMFLANNDDENDVYIIMSSCYAYDRKKYMDKRIEVGENLVGQCYLEGESIFLTDVPDDYINITSGLGDANPRSILLVPLKFNDQIYGVIEMASFNIYKDYQISFIEKVAESIASTISTVKVNLRTIKLLEDSKLKSEELAAQEEEMRQNMEELQTTQEESARKEVEMNGILNALNTSYLVAEMDLDGNIITINESALAVLGVSKDSAEGHNIRDFINDNESEEFELLWQDVLDGKTVNRNHYVTRATGKILLSESYTPIYDDEEQMYKVLNIGVEVRPDEIN